MSLYKEFSTLFPYLQSVRKLQNFLSFDVMFSTTWKLPEKVSTNIQNIINYNLEREEKDQLFQDKVNELKTLFEKQSLKNLKQLKFEFKQTKIELEDNVDEIRESAKLVSE